MNRIDRIEYDLAGRVIGCAMRVHRALGSGFLESVYQKALALELTREKIPFTLSRPLEVYYDGAIVGQFVADAVIDNRLIVENKAVQQLVTAHEVQLVNYLTATGIDEGLLLNFGASKLEFKKKFRVRKLPPISLR